MTSQPLRFATRNISDPLVERDADGLPVAFRIWHYGDNPSTDGGVDSLNDEALEFLRAQIANHVGSYPFDVNHLSLLNKSSPEAQKAVGWHSIEERSGPDGPEIWATNCDWTQEARDWLLQDPPAFKYFSPAFHTVENGNTIRFYLNCALTNTPGTLGIQALRSGAPSMDYEKLADALGLSGEARAAFLAAVAGKSQEELAAMLAGAAPVQEPPASDPSLNSAAEGNDPPAVTETRSDAGGAGDPPQQRGANAFPPVVRNALAALFKPKVAPARREASAAGAPAATAAQTTDPVVLRARNALDLKPAQTEPGPQWVTTPSGATYHVRTAVDRVKVHQIIARESGFVSTMGVL